MPVTLPTQRRIIGRQSTMTYAEIAYERKNYVAGKLASAKGMDFYADLRRYFWLTAYASEAMKQIAQDVAVIFAATGHSDDQLREMLDVATGSINNFRNGKINFDKYEIIKTRFAPSSRRWVPSEQERMLGAMAKTIDYVSQVTGSDQSIDRIGLEFLVRISESDSFLNATPDQLLPSLKCRILQITQQSIDDYVQNNLWFQRLNQTVRQFHETGKAMPKPLVEYVAIRESLGDRRFIDGHDDNVDQLFHHFIGAYLVICDELF